MKQQNRKPPIVFRLGMVLICLLIVTSYMMSGLYAKYATNSEAGDSARVAKFDVKNQITTVDAKINLNVYHPNQLTDELQIRVTSSGEVAVKYDVIVTLPANADGYSWLNVKLDDGSIAPAVSENVFTFSNVGTFSPGGFSKDHTVTFSIPEAYQGKPGNNISGGLSITVRAEQID